MLTASALRRRRKGPVLSRRRTIPIKVTSGKKRRPVPSFTRPSISHIRKSYHRPAQVQRYVQIGGVAFGNEPIDVVSMVNRANKAIREDERQELAQAKTAAEKRKIKEIYDDIRDKVRIALWRGDIGGVQRIQRTTAALPFAPSRKLTATPYVRMALQAWQRGELRTSQQMKDFAQEALRADIESKVDSMPTAFQRDRAERYYVRRFPVILREIRAQIDQMPGR